MFAAKNELFTRPSGGYQISRSLRFNSADSANLSRTFGTPTNNKIWTYSVWVKKSRPTSNYDSLFSVSDSKVFRFGYTGSDFILNFIDTNTGWYFTTTQVFRDPSAWMHLVLVINTTDATAGNRTKVYVNGIQVTAFSAKTDPSQNAASSFNTTVAHYIGQAPTSGHYFDGYMTEVNFIDGQALTPSSFGETNAQTGVWQPKAYSGSYGTNGFYLNFSDNSNTTAATLGKDYSGNGNNWTPTGFLVSAGADNDSLVDSPTSYGTDTGVGGSVRGNYATFNPLVKVDSQPTLSNGNLLSTAPAGWSSAVGTIGLTSGKWYWEIVNGLADAFVGICGDNATLGTVAPQSSTATILYYGNTGNKRIDAVDTAYGSAFSTQTIGVALDIDGGTIVFYRDNVSQGSISLSSSTLNGRTIFPLSGVISTTATVNFGQRPFAYTAPSGFKALCTQNLPTPTIGATTATTADKYFGINLWTGNGSSQTITNGGFQPDWVWVKERSAVRTNCLTDAVRGFTKYLFSETTGTEETYSTLVTSVNSNGFNLGASFAVNDSGQTYVGWQWKANGSGSSNTSGSITSTVSASTTRGFSVVTYTGTGANATVGHGIGSAVKMLITKRRDSAGPWICGHTGLTSWAYAITFNAAGAQYSAASDWNSTAPTSTVFSLGNDPDVNTSGGTYVAYCFAEVAGYSAFGSYTGNGSADGPFVFTGMRPALLLVKRTDTTADWVIFDSARNGYNIDNKILFPNLSSAESASGTTFDILSNGFKARNTNGEFNGNNSPYIYMAFASNPFKYSLAR